MNYENIELKDFLSKDVVGILMTRYDIDASKYEKDFVDAYMRTEDKDHFNHYLMNIITDTNFDAITIKKVLTSYQKVSKETMNKKIEKSKSTTTKKTSSKKTIEEETLILDEETGEVITTNQQIAYIYNIYKELEKTATAGVSNQNILDIINANHEETLSCLTKPKFKKIIPNISKKKVSNEFLLVMILSSYLILILLFIVILLWK